MTYPKWILPALALAVACLIVGSVYGRSCYLRHKGATAVVQADTHVQAEAIHAAQGAALDQHLKIEAPELKADDDQVARLRAELEKLRKAPAPTLPDPQPLLSPVDLAPTVAKQSELIQAQANQISGLKGTILTLTASRDSWRSACEESQRATACLRIAHEAQLSAIKAERWKGRFEGFGVGLASGYITGRLR